MTIIITKQNTITCGYRESFMVRIKGTWAPVSVLPDALPLQLPAYGLRRQRRMAKVLGTLHPHGRARRSFVSPQL